MGEHDENISFEQTVELVGADRAAELRDLSLEIYARAARTAEEHGLILADTKFEFGLDDAGVLTLADEVLTSDSSRYWDAAAWRTGTTPAERMASFDKQIVRDWLAAHWDKTGTPPELPAEIVRAHRRPLPRAAGAPHVLSALALGRECTACCRVHDVSGGARVFTRSEPCTRASESDASRTTSSVSSTVTARGSRPGSRSRSTSAIFSPREGGWCIVVSCGETDIRPGNLEADDRDVVGDGDAGTTEHREGAPRDQVTGDEERVRLLGTLEDAGHRRGAVVGGEFLSSTATSSRPAAASA